MVGAVANSCWALVDAGGGLVRGAQDAMAILQEEQAVASLMSFTAEN